MTYPDFPFRSRYLDVDGQRMHYVDEGAGEPILMLHGNPTWSYLYRHFIADLREDFRCVAPDHLGFGFSDKPRHGDYSMRAHMLRLQGFVNKLDLRDVTVVVQDWGGIIGLGWAVRNRRLVKRLVIMNTAGFPPPSKEALLGMNPVPWGLLMLYPLKIPVLGEVFVQGLNGFVKRLLPAGISHKERLDSKVMQGYLDPYPTWASRRAHLASVRQIPFSTRHPTWRLLQEIGAELDGWTVPTQLIWGMRDPVFVPWFLEEFERRLPNHAPSVKLWDASHFLQDDTPEPIIATIRSFMKSTPAPAERAPATDQSIDVGG
ncbi:MAG: alpha/beta fold hydrolase [Polyangiaceae bacterium]|nr:alpha/beta fold hydrolase [Polyangiaceae bacterium]